MGDEHLRVLFVVLTVSAALVLAATASAKIARIPHRCTTKPAAKLCAIHFHKQRADRAREAIGRPRLPYRWVAEGQPRLRDRLLTLWIQHQHHWEHVRASYHATPWTAGWLSDALCVHHYEGAWNANTGNGYYGGFQFDLATWASNGGTGSPAQASPTEQLRVAYQAWKHRGWAPWPATSAMCGL
jgi:hypothetical protein